MIAIQELKTNIKACQDTNRFLSEKNRNYKNKNDTLSKKLAGAENELKLRQSWEKRQLQREHSERLTKEKEAGKTKVKDLQNLTLELRQMMQSHAADIEIKDNTVRDLRRKVWRLSTENTSTKDRFANKKDQLEDWKVKYNLLLEQLEVEQQVKGVLAEEVVQWKETVTDLEEQLMQCQDTIHDTAPIVIKKHWVKNIGKKG